MPNTYETIFSGISSFFVGWKLGQIFSSSDQLPYYDLQTKQIYNDLISHYHQQIQIETLESWSVISEVNNGEQKIRPRHIANNLREAVVDYNRTILTLEQYTEDEVNDHHAEILRCIVDFLESILNRHDERSNMSYVRCGWQNMCVYFNLGQHIPRLDGPEIMFFTETAESIINSYNDNLDNEKINHRTIYCENILNSRMANHRHSSNHLVAEKLDLILGHYKSIKDIISDRQENKDIPQSLNDMLRSINFVNKKTLHLIYRLTEGSKRDFDIDEFMNGNINEAQTTTEHELGKILHSSLAETGINNVFSTNRFPKKVLDRVLQETLKKLNNTHKIFKNSTSSGIREFFETPEKRHHIFNFTIDILQDVFRLYFYSKRLCVINEALSIIGINWMITHESTKTSIETQLEITKKTFLRLLSNIKRYINIYDKAIEQHHLKQNKHSNDPIYQNTHNAIIEFNHVVLNDKKMSDLFEKSYVGINSLIQNKNNEPLQITIETKEILIMWYNGVLESIILETGSSNEDYILVQRKLGQALNELKNVEILEPSQEISDLIQEILNLLIATTNNDHETPCIDRNHTWRSIVLKDIYDRAVWKYKAGTELCDNFYRKLKLAIYKIETNPSIISIGMSCLEIILSKFVDQHKQICYPSPPLHIQPLKALSFKVEAQQVNVSLDEEKLNFQLVEEHKDEYIKLLPDEITYQLTEQEQKELAREEKALLTDIKARQQTIKGLEQEINSYAH
ncbi:MAG: hypothetical protein P8L77_05940 [Gammaproteobacteria bacterium]|nr:hypothetical protein [Gammaproteobacteria bacterium]